MPDRIEVLRCEHEKFAAHVAVNRMEDTGSFLADIRIECEQCGTQFHFIGCDFGNSYRRPMVNIGGLELSVPIGPGSLPLPPPGTPIIYELHPKVAKAAQDEIDRENLPDHAQPDERDEK